MISSSGYPRTRILFGVMLVSAVRHWPSATRGCARRSTVNVFRVGFIVSSPCRSAGSPGRSPMLLGSVESITEIAEARHDEFVGVQAGVDNRREHVHVRVVALDECDAFGRRDDANHSHLAGTGLAEQIEGGDRTAAGGQ